MKIRTTLLLLVVVAAFGCSSASTPRPTATPAPTHAVDVPGADDGLNATVWTNLSTEHDLIFEEIYRNARETLLAALADPSWDALVPEERTNEIAGLPPAVILDVDETVLDNAGYQTELIVTGNEYDDFTWAEWCKREVATALPGVLEFTRFATEHGVEVFYITNRARELSDATLDNLRKEGFPVASDDVFLGLGKLLPGCEQIGSAKGCRRRLVARDHRVLMQFGDQVGDFLDVTANTLDGRRAAVAPYGSWFGERWWVLPNPTYGSWEPATFGNQWALPRAERRRKKIEALATN